MEGSVLIPACIGIFRIGDPSVDAIAIPPWFAVVSLETSLPFASVVTPSVISLSVILNDWAFNRKDEPATLTFPETLKLPVIVNPLDCEMTPPGAVPVKLLALL